MSVEIIYCSANIHSLPPAPMRGKKCPHSLTLVLAMWLALANRMLADVLCSEPSNLPVWLGLLSSATAFCHENNMPWEAPTPSYTPGSNLHLELQLNELSFDQWNFSCLEDVSVYCHMTLRFFCYLLHSKNWLIQSPTDTKWSSYFAAPWHFYVKY